MRKTLRVAVMCTAVSFFVSAGATAQDDVDATSRLRQAIEPDPERPPSLDTVLLFTNLGRNPAKVSMKAYDSNGHPRGSKDIEVPGNGVAYVLASDLDEDTSDRRFIGKVDALCRGNMTGTAVLVGGAVTDLPAIVRLRNLNSVLSTAPVTDAITQIIFPVVAAY